MRVVGQMDRSDIELDPAKAWRRARLLDRMLSGAAPPVLRGVFRGSHEHFNRMDRERQKIAARSLNKA